MTLAERRHDRLAVRLSLIISRLLAGETQHVGKLAAEFGVSVRTLRRDFRERLMYLDLEYHRGMCRLRSGGSVSQRELDILTFAWRSGMGDVFPGLDRKMVNMLLACDESPCLVWSSPCIRTFGSDGDLNMGTTTAGSNVTFSPSQNGTALDVQAGVEAQIRQNVTLGVQGGYTRSVSGNSAGGYNGQATLKVAF